MNKQELIEWIKNNQFRSNRIIGYYVVNSDELIDFIKSLSQPEPEPKKSAWEILKKKDFGWSEEIMNDIVIAYSDVIEAMQENAQQLPSDEILIDMLLEISKWVKQENQFMPLEYLGVLKEWLKEQITQ